MFRGWFSQPFYADCVPLYFADPVNHAIGLSHSGWRGTVQKIGAVTIEKMSEEYGSNPKDLKVAIGPSICQECYEVSEDVIEEFEKVFDKKYRNRLFYRKRKRKISVKSVDGKQDYFSGSGNPGRKHFHAKSLYLL